MNNDNGSRRARTSALTRNEIAAAALRMFATDGLSGLSMRRLGSELGVHYSTLYWHIADKRELLRLVLDAVLADVPAPDAEATWQDNLGALFSGLRTALRGHPGAAALLLDLGMSGPHASTFCAGAKHQLVGAGLDDERAEWAFRALIRYTAAAVQEESARPCAESGRAARDGERPAVADHSADGAAERSGESDARFQYGLGCLMTGIAATT